MLTPIRILVADSPPDVIATNVEPSFCAIGTADKLQLSNRTALSLTTCAAGEMGISYVNYCKICSFRSNRYSWLLLV